jgi:dTDP-4-dehydrorhamnose 3,5-epimerase
MDTPGTEIDGIKLLAPVRYEDARGSFSEIYNAERFRQAGIACEFVLDSLSLSHRPGTVRGLHFQAPPHAQDKLIRVARGAVFDVVVDIRGTSPTFGRHCTFRLDSRTGTQLFVPRGFLHGFCTLEPDTEVVYKLSALYAPEAEYGVLWNDPDLGIEWPVSPTEAVLSAKDAGAPRLRDVPRFF